MATKYHQSADDFWTRCHATVRRGAGVSGCPLELDGVTTTHPVGFEVIALAGGGAIRRWIADDTYRVTKIVVNGDGTFSAIAGKLTRVYTMAGKLVPLEERLQALRAKPTDSKGAVVASHIDAALDDMGETYELSDADRVAITSAYVAAVDEVPIDKSIMERLVQDRLVDNAKKIAMAAPEELRAFF
jgi:hypothetical protein